MVYFFLCKMYSESPQGWRKEENRVMGQLLFAWDKEGPAPSSWDLSIVTVSYSERLLSVCRADAVIPVS